MLTLGLRKALRGILGTRQLINCCYAEFRVSMSRQSTLVGAPEERVHWFRYSSQRDIRLKMLPRLNALHPPQPTLFNTKYLHNQLEHSLQSSHTFIYIFTMQFPTLLVAAAFAVG